MLKIVNGRYYLDGKGVGEERRYDGQKVFEKKCTPEHYFKIFQGFGIAEEVIKKLIERDIDFIRIHYFGKKGRKVYVTTPLEWLEKGKHHKSDGYEEQLILTETDFIKGGEE